MKKLLIILIAAVSFNAASAQSRNGSYQKKDRKQVTQTKDNHNYNDQSRSKDYAYNNSDYNKDYAYNDNSNDRRYNTNYGKNDDHNRQAEYDRINHDYDQRINQYKNDRSMSWRERERRIYEAQQERQRSLTRFGTGAVAGGVVGFLLGVLVSH